MEYKVYRPMSGDNQSLSAAKNYDELDEYVMKYCAELERTTNDVIADLYIKTLKTTASMEAIKIYQDPVASKFLAAANAIDPSDPHAEHAFADLIIQLAHEL